METGKSEWQESCDDSRKDEDDKDYSSEHDRSQQRLQRGYLFVPTYRVSRETVRPSARFFVAASYA